MAKKPELIKISENEYGCTFGDWKAEALKPRELTEGQWEQRRRKQFEEHVRQQHSREDFSQAAVRIVREATEDR
jgi:hypothetical protein